jgi:uncharacterized membrane protein YphA (DoxX/SURF4 family)
MARYNPGFLGVFFIVLLRIAIGWHFFYEGWEKVESRVEGKAPFSAEVYVRNATGPLAPYFRRMIPDVDGLALLDPPTLKTRWTKDVDRLIKHYDLGNDKKAQAQQILDENLKWIDYWFQDPDVIQKQEKYQHELKQVEAVERNPRALSYEKERAWDARKALDADRRSVTAPVVEREKALVESIDKLAKSDQIKVAEPPAAEWTSLDVANNVTIAGLLTIGLCLMAGFLTPFAALCAAVFLAMIYLSMPPWPGLPANPRAEGHYWIVSKNLVELIACLVIATTPSGHWVGLDALVFGARRRRRLAARTARESGRQAIQNDPDRPRLPVPMP